MTKSRDRLESVFGIDRDDTNGIEPEVEPTQAMPKFPTSLGGISPSGPDSEEATTELKPKAGEQSPVSALPNIHAPESTQIDPDLPIEVIPFPATGDTVDAYTKAMEGKALPGTVQQMLELMPPEVIDWMQGKGEAPAEIRKMMNGVVDRTNWFIAYSCMTQMAQMAKLQTYLNAVQEKVFNFQDIDMADDRQLRADWYGITEQMVKIMDFTRKFVNQSQGSLSRMGAEADEMQNTLQSMDPKSLRDFRTKLLLAKKAANSSGKVV